MSYGEIDYNGLPVATLADLERYGATVILLVPVSVGQDGPVVVEEMRLPLSALREWLKEPT